MRLEQRVANFFSFFFLSCCAPAHHDGRQRQDWQWLAGLDWNMPRTRSRGIAIGVRDKRRFPDDVHTILFVVMPERVDTNCYVSLSFLFF